MPQRGFPTRHRQFRRNSSRVRSDIEYSPSAYSLVSVIPRHSLMRENTHLQYCIRVVYFVLSSLFGGTKEPAKFITPYIKECLLKREESDERPVSQP